MAPSQWKARSLNLYLFCDQDLKYLSSIRIKDLQPYRGCSLTLETPGSNSYISVFCTLDFHKEEALTFIHSKYLYLLELIVTPFYSLASKSYNDDFSSAMSKIKQCKRECN